MTTKKAPVPAAPVTETGSQLAAGTSPAQAGTPSTAGEPPTGDEPPADTRSEREKQLETYVDELVEELQSVSNERDHLLDFVLADAPEDEFEGFEDEPDDEDEDDEPSKEAVLKELLQRNGLKKAWLLDSGPCFDEKHARHVAGPDFDALPVIEA